jgi:hypothetical protein
MNRTAALLMSNFGYPTGNDNAVNEKKAVP